MTTTPVPAPPTAVVLAVANVAPTATHLRQRSPVNEGSLDHRSSFTGIGRCLQLVRCWPRLHYRLRHCPPPAWPPTTAPPGPPVPAARPIPYRRQDGTYTVYGRVYDKDGGKSAVYTRPPSSVDNVPPTVTDHRTPQRRNSYSEGHGDHPGQHGFTDPGTARCPHRQHRLERRPRTTTAYVNLAGRDRHPSAASFTFTYGGQRQLTSSSWRLNDKARRRTSVDSHRLGQCHQRRPDRGHHRVPLGTLAGRHVAGIQPGQHRHRPGQATTPSTVTVAWSVKKAPPLGTYTLATTGTVHATVATFSFTPDNEAGSYAVTLTGHRQGSTASSHGTRPPRPSRSTNVAPVVTASGPASRPPRGRPRASLLWDGLRADPGHRRPLERQRQLDSDQRLPDLHDL